MWQEELRKYISLTGKEEMSCFLQKENKLAPLFNLYTTTFSPEMLDNLLELMIYDHINRHFTLETLEEVYNFCTDQSQREFFMRCIDIMAYGSHIYRGLKNFSFEHPIFHMDDASREMILAYENCQSYISEISDFVAGELQDKLMWTTDRLIYPMESIFSSFYQDTFLPQTKTAIERGNQKELLRLFRKCMDKKDLYLRGLNSSVNVLDEITQELEEWIDEEDPEYEVESKIYALENEVDTYQNNSKIYSKQKELLMRYRNPYNK